MRDQHAGEQTQSSPSDVGPRLLPGAEARRAGLVKSLRAGDWAWLGLATAAVAYEAAASSRRDWELLSEACDRYRTRRPVVVSATIVYLAAHLVRLVPRPIDPLYILATRCTWRAP
jgi:hypothetical protein